MSNPAVTDATKTSAQQTPNMLKLYSSARKASAPIVTIRTADQFATAAAIVGQAADKRPVVKWDAVCGLTAVDGNSLGKRALGAIGLTGSAETPDETVNFVAAMIVIKKLPRGSVVLAFSAHRQLQSMEPIACAAAIQAVANLRDELKKDFRMLVLMGPSFIIPPELELDIVSIDHELPSQEDLKAIVTDVHKSVAGLAVPTGVKMDKAVEAVCGLSHFAAEQVTAMSLTTEGLDLDALWDRKRAIIEQTPGLSVYRGGETFDDVRGLDNLKRRLRTIAKSTRPIGVVCWIDEGADVFQNVEQDTSGVKTDQQRALLVEMEQHRWRGIICCGVTGTGKSLIARAFGNEVGVPTIALDMGAMEAKFVGESEANMRAAMRTINAVGNGNAFFILTCNSLKGIRPQFQRRFRRGVFFFDLLTKDGQKDMLAHYTKKYALKAQPAPDMDGWNGAEIADCCEDAAECGMTLREAAEYIMPAARARSTDIDAMRREANEKFLDATNTGLYKYTAEPMAKLVRGIDLPVGRSVKES